jgi:hypothetical protein
MVFPNKFRLMLVFSKEFSTGDGVFRKLSNGVGIFWCASVGFFICWQDSSRFNIYRIFFSNLDWLCSFSTGFSRVLADAGWF